MFQLPSPFCDFNFDVTKLLYVYFSHEPFFGTELIKTQDLVNR